MRKFTSIHWVMALFIAAISLCSVLPGQHVRASEYSPVGVGGLFAAAEENDPYSCLQFPPPWPDFRNFGRTSGTVWG